jgi:hypothetical protein
MPSNSKRSEAPRGAIREIAVGGMLLCILIIQEYALIGIPNVQLTVLLLMVYAAVLPWRILLPLTVAYVFLDNFLMGSLSLIYFPAMVVAWMTLVVITKWLSRKPLWVLVIFATFFGFLYGWFFMIPQLILFPIDPWAYLASDLVFEVVMAITDLITVSLLFPILRPVLERLWHPGKPEDVRLED